MTRRHDHRVKVRAAALLAGVAMVASGCSAVFQTAQKDSGDNFLCPSKRKVSPIDATLVMRDSGPTQELQVQIGQAFRVSLKSADGDLEVPTAIVPNAPTAEIVCLAIAKPVGRQRTVTFVAVDVGNALLGSTTAHHGEDVTGYSATVTVTAPVSSHGHP